MQHGRFKEATAPREPRASRDDATLYLSDTCGFGSHVDAEMILRRVVHLARQGETATSIACRLNPPARA